MTVRTTCLVLLLVLSVVSTAPAAPGDDSFIAGYAAAVLEREFGLTAPSLRVQNGVVTLAVSDLLMADRARVVAHLEQIRGVARVVLLEPGAQPPAPPPVVPTSRRASWSTGRPGCCRAASSSSLWWPTRAGLISVPPTSTPSTIPSSKTRPRSSFGESFAFYRNRLGGWWWEIGLHAAVSRSSTWTRPRSISSTPTTWSAYR